MNKHLYELGKYVCMCCGDYVPEVRQVCPEREEGVVECKQEETR